MVCWSRAAATTQAERDQLVREEIRDERREAARAARQDERLKQVGVLFSSNYSSLHDGYWGAYTGVLDRSATATRQAEARAAGFGDAYAREVSP